MLNSEAFFMPSWKTVRWGYAMGVESNHSNGPYGIKKLFHPILKQTPWKDQSCKIEYTFTMAFCIRNKEVRPGIYVLRDW